MKLRIAALIVASLLVLFLGFIWYTFSTTGFLRDIKNTSKLEVLRAVEIPGAEDITIAPNGQFAIISSDDRAARRDGRDYVSGLYWMDLNDLDTDPRLISDELDLSLHPHGIHLLTLGADRYQLLVVNHVDGQHSIERFFLLGDSLTHLGTIKDPSMISPNDVVAIDEDHFFFTNDHGYTSSMGVFFENYLGLAVSNVVLSDGDGFREVANGIAYANGINYDHNQGILYVASPRNFKIIAYRVSNDFTLNHLQDIYVGMGTDNLEIDENGAVWTAGHPNLLRWSSYAAGKAETAPSEVLSVQLHGPGKEPVEQWMLDDGNLISGASVAARKGNLVLIGNVMDKQFLITEMK